jgi:hypothetical protein
MQFLRVSSIFVLLGLLLASLFSSCESENKRKTRVELFEKEYVVEDFNQLKFEGGYNVKISQGEVHSVKVHTTDIQHGKLKLDVIDSILYFKNRMKNVGPDEINVTIVLTDLKRIKVEGGIFLQTTDFLNVDEINIDIEGGAHAQLKINADVINAKTAGGVNLEFEGKTDSFTIISEGAGNINASKLEARYVNCRVAGVGNASVWPTEQLDATVEGVGKIGYRGSPNVNKQVNGIGVVYRK